MPKDLGKRLQELGPWCFSTRTIRMWPYNISNFVQEADAGVVDDYALLAHAGHGCNSYALHYYLVREDLKLFLQLPWGGVYEDPKEDGKRIEQAFTLAARLTKAVEQKAGLEGRGPVAVVASGFYGSAWRTGSDCLSRDRRASAEPLSMELRPTEALAAALAWVEGLSHSHPSPSKKGATPSIS